MSDIEHDELLAALAEVLAVDEPIREDVAAAIEHEAFALRRVDDELAALLYDTGLEATAGVRGGDGPRGLSFAAAGHELDVELHPDDTMIGRVSPPDLEVSVEGPAGTVALHPDRLGRFTADVPAGRLRFVLAAAASAARVVTPWIFRSTSPGLCHRRCRRRHLR